MEADFPFTSTLEIKTIAPELVFIFQSNCPFRLVSHIPIQPFGKPFSKLSTIRSHLNCPPPDDLTPSLLWGLSNFLVALVDIWAGGAGAQDSTAESRTAENPNNAGFMLISAQVHSDW